MAYGHTRSKPLAGCSFLRELHGRYRPEGRYPTRHAFTPAVEIPAVKKRTSAARSCPQRGQANQWFEGLWTLGAHSAPLLSTCKLGAGAAILGLSIAECLAVQASFEAPHLPRCRGLKHSGAPRVKRHQCFTFSPTISTQPTGDVARGPPAPPRITCAGRWWMWVGLWVRVDRGSKHPRFPSKAPKTWRTVTPTCYLMLGAMTKGRPEASRLASPTGEVHQSIVCVQCIHGGQRSRLSSEKCDVIVCSASC
jgi:hypothetical protein